MNHRDQLSLATENLDVVEYEKRRTFFVNHQNSTPAFSPSSDCDAVKTASFSIYSASDSESLPEYDIAYTQEISKQPEVNTFAGVASCENTRDTSSPLLTGILKYHDELSEAIRRSLLEISVAEGIRASGRSDVPTPAQVPDPQLNMAPNETPTKTIDQHHERHTDRLAASPTITKTISRADSLTSKVDKEKTSSSSLHRSDSKHHHKSKSRHKDRKDSSDSRESSKSHRSHSSHRSSSRQSSRHRHKSSRSSHSRQSSIERHASSSLHKQGHNSSSQNLHSSQSKHSHSKTYSSSKSRSRKNSTSENGCVVVSSSHSHSHNGKDSKGYRPKSRSRQNSNTENGVTSSRSKEKSILRKNSGLENGYTESNLEHSSDESNDRLLNSHENNTHAIHTEQNHGLLASQSPEDSCTNDMDTNPSQLRNSSCECQSPGSKRKAFFPDTHGDIKRPKIASPIKTITNPLSKPVIKPLAVKRKHSVDSSSDDKDTDSDPSLPSKTRYLEYENLRVTRKKTHQLQRIYSEGGAPASSSSSSANSSIPILRPKLLPPGISTIRNMWDLNIYDPEFSDSDQSGRGGNSKHHRSRPLPATPDSDPDPDPDDPNDPEWTLEQCLNKRSPVVTLPKLALQRNDVVDLKNLDGLRKSLLCVRAQQLSRSSADGTSPRHFTDGLQSAGSASPASPVLSMRDFINDDSSDRGCSSTSGSRRSSMDSDKGIFSAFLPSPVGSRRSSGLSEKGHSSPSVCSSVTRADSICSEKGLVLASPLNLWKSSQEQESEEDDEESVSGDAPPVPTFVACGSSTLRRLPRISSRPDPLLSTPSPSHGLSPLVSRDYQSQISHPISGVCFGGVGGAGGGTAVWNKQRRPSFFSVPSRPASIVAPSTLPDQDEEDQEDTSEMQTFDCQQQEFVNISLDDESWEYKINGVDTVAKMTSANLSPDDKTLRKLVDLLILSPKHNYSQCIHNVLMAILHQHPPFGSLPFDFERLEHVVELWLTASCPLESHRNLLALEYMVAALDADVMPRSFNSQKQLSKSVAYKWFAAADKTPQLRKLLEWLVTAVKVAETTPHSERVLSALDQMVDLALGVGGAGGNGGGGGDLLMRCVTDLKNEYLMLPTLKQKSKLLRCLSSPRLTFKLCHHILEDYCSANLHGSTNTHTLEDFVPAYFCAVPPQYHLPPTPAHTDDSAPSSPSHSSPTSTPNSSGTTSPWSAAECEELVLLQWVALRGYVAWAGRDRAQGGGGLHEGDVAMLKRLPELVADLRLTLMAHVRASTEAGGTKDRDATKDRGEIGPETAMKGRGGAVENGGGERENMRGQQRIAATVSKGRQAAKGGTNGWGEREGQLTNDTHLYLAKLSMLSVAAGVRDRTTPMVASHL